MRNKRIWIAAAVLVAAVAAYLAGRDGSSKEVRVLSTAQARVGDVRKVLQATGIVKDRKSVV